MTIGTKVAIVPLVNMRAGSARLQDKVQNVVVTFVAIVSLLGSLALAAPSVSPRKCTCCHVKVAENSCVPACCRAPAKDEAPSAPAPSQTFRTMDWNALAQIISIELYSPAAGVSFLKPSSTLPTARVVPIFERDCSYLI